MHILPSRRRLDVFGRMIRSTYLELFLFWILLNVSFTAIYFLMTTLHPGHGLNLPISMGMWERLYDSFYFSVATATTLGYGDIVPLGLSKLFSVLESSIGVMVFTLLVAKMASEGQKQ